jgi:hypothetical protein
MCSFEMASFDSIAACLRNGSALNESAGMSEFQEKLTFL